MKYTDFTVAMGIPIADTNLLHLIGEQSDDDDELPKPEGLTYYIFRRTGVEIIARGASRNVSTVILYGPEYATNYDVFLGELPDSIAFGESANDIKSKLGPSDSQVLTDKPGVDERLFLRLRYKRTGHLLDLVFNQHESLFLVRLLAVPQPARI
ncbi:MAG: hypothetical protein EKK48_10335 [Candidatus Melainabacteria bacterium]|nr:MAG: hypothetical protein EKK48_10335 [Candidatus Melainabacteria bacterium]